jgi:hypothetical protein
MTPSAESDRAAVVEAFDELDAAVDKVLGLSFEAMTDAEKVAPLNRMERNACRIRHAHHLEGWAADNGPTNIDKLTLACGPDNRLVEQGGWTTRNRNDGRTEWIPPPNLDTGQTRVNNYHHPEKYLVDDEDDEDP